MKGFGSRLSEARNAKGLTQLQLSKIMRRKTQVTISRWENDITEPTLSEVVFLCFVLDVSADWLLGLSDDPKNNQPKIAN